MAKPDADDQKARVDNMSTGGHLGGTKFGQTPGEASHVTNANPAEPEKQDSGKKDK